MKFPVILKGRIKKKWAKLSDADLYDIINGRKKLESKIQERYGLGKEQIEKDVRDWIDAQWF